MVNTTTLAPGCAEAVCNPQIDPATNKLVGYVFDTAGNTTTDANGQTFIYDAENKQVQVNNPNGTVGQYFYDGDGKRIKKIVLATGETTIFVYDAVQKLVAEYSTLVEPASTAKISYLTNDHLGSPRITTNALGQIVSRRDFMPFGEEIVRANYGTDTVRQKFTGYERDDETEMDFAQARYFAYNHGRFTSPDPYNIVLEKESCKGQRRKDRKLKSYLVEPHNWNRYVYVLNNPLKLVDPTGQIYLRVGEMIYYIEDDAYKNLNKKELQKQIGKYTIVEEGSIVTIGSDATGIFEPYKGQRVVLGKNGKLLPIDEYGAVSLGDLGTVQSEHAPETPPLLAPDDDLTWGYLRFMIPEAEGAERKHFSGRSNPYSGGYRHCVASCVATKRFGSAGVTARSVWDLLFEHGNPAVDSRSDMAAENVGQFLGENPSGRCEIMCLNAYPPRWR